MKRIYFIVILFLFPILSFAADGSSIGILQSINEFFSFCSQTVADFGTFLNTSLPNLFERSTAWLIEMWVYLKFKLMLEGAIFAFHVAQQIIQDLNLGTYLSNAVSMLPPKMKYVMTQWKLFDGITLILHAAMTRFVMNFLGF